MRDVLENLLENQIPLYQLKSPVLAGLVPHQTTRICACKLCSCLSGSAPDVCLFIAANSDQSQFFILLPVLEIRLCGLSFPGSLLKPFVKFCHLPILRCKGRKFSSFIFGLLEEALLVSGDLLLWHMNPADPCLVNDSARN